VGLYCSGGISPSSIAWIISSTSGASVERLSRSRPSSTSRCTSHETGATFEYQGHCVSLLWQSMQAPRISSSVRGLFQLIGRPPDGFVWSRP